MQHNLKVGWIALYCLQCILAQFTCASELKTVVLTLNLPAVWKLDSGNVIQRQNKTEHQLISIKLNNDHTAVFMNEGKPSSMLAIAVMPRQGSTTALDYQKMTVVEGNVKLVKPAFEQNLAGHQFAVLELEEKLDSHIRYETSYVSIIGNWIFEMTLVCKDAPICFDVKSGFVKMDQES